MSGAEAAAATGTGGGGGGEGEKEGGREGGSQTHTAAADTEGSLNNTHHTCSANLATASTRGGSCL